MIDRLRRSRLMRTLSSILSFLILLIRNLAYNNSDAWRCPEQGLSYGKLPASATHLLSKLQKVIRSSFCIKFYEFHETSEKNLRNS